MNSVDKWTKYKWALLLSVITVFAYGIIGMVYSILTWFRSACSTITPSCLLAYSTLIAWTHADVMYVADNDVLILINTGSL